ncbi:hypothetical protein H7F15_05635 [Pontibacter sp. Tf4]|uniref:KAP family P-loop NTPase fold protein n=1 Tax=Pontibacter sp. Tf4 TaxID=2761620 RepID=UPI001629C4AC|nr:P-loop NTPase fold protein [Pontibacter sp. Tf4]MBB6610509.1 hypothetical protein [Pontibacter sp. Tf4]
MDSEIRINFLDYITTKKALFTILSLVLLLVFWDLAWDKFDEVFVEPTFSKVKPHWILDWLHILIVYFTIILTIYAYIKDKRVSIEIFSLSTLTLLIYSYWRFISDKYNFVSLTFIPYHKHGDLILLFYTCISILSIKGWFNKLEEPKDFKDPFLVDKPIAEIVRDELGRRKFAEKIAYKIQSKPKLDDSGALAIGINGIWGSGKTSFSNLIKCYIDPHNRIIIDFNPWSSTSPTKIIEDFFEQLIDAMAKYDPRLSKSISDYAKSLTSIDENSITKGLNSISDFLFNGNSKSYEEINESIGRLKKQIIIIIDDLDRLDKYEIVEVLRIVRNTASFNNVIYVVSYDRNYIEEAIKLFNPYNYKSFLEKIFQFEFTLPKYDNSIYREMLITAIKENIDAKYISLVDSAVEARTNTGRSFTNEIVRTKRDVIRLANSIIFEFSLTEEEVHFEDFYLLQLLKIKHQRVYEQLYQYKDIFFITETSNNDKYLRLRKESEKSLDDNFSDVFRLLNTDGTYGNSKKEVKSDDETEIFRSFLDNRIADEFEKDFVYSIVVELLREKNYSEAASNKEKYKSFRYPGNLYKYFSFQRLTSDIPTREFEELRRGNYEVYKQQIFDWINDGKLSELLDRLEKINDFTTYTEYENHLNVSLDIGKYRYSNGQYYGLNYWQIIKTLRYPSDKLETTEIFNSRDEYEDFVRQFFLSAPPPYTFESNIVVTAMSDANDFILKNNELTSINLDYFNKYREANKAVTVEFRELYRNCVKLDPSASSKYTIVPEATKQFKRHFKIYLKTCELSGFIMHSTPQTDSFHIHGDWIKEIFNTIQTFEIYLNSASNLDREDMCFKEFVTFYEKSKVVPDRFISVEFNFQHLNPDRYK